MKYKNTNRNVQSGDYICYTLKNEIGKIKRVADDNRVFAWFHTGDTASGIDTDHFTFVLEDMAAKAMPEDELIDYLKECEFSNAYAIEGIIEKRSIN